MQRLLGFVLVMASIPFFYALMRGPVAQRRFGSFAIGALPFVMSAFHLSIALISWALWPGYVKGMIVDVLDTLALVILLTDRDRTPGRPLLWGFMLLITACAITVVYARPAEAAFFFVWQLACTTLVFMAVSKIATRPEPVRAIIGGLAAAACYEAFYSIMQRLQGVPQARGAMVHPNMLGLCLHTVLFLSLGAVLGGDRRPLLKAGVASAIISIALTGSRATTALAGAGVIALLLLSLIRRPTPAKRQIVTVGLGAVLLVAPIGYMSVQHRYTTDSASSSDSERIAFESAARSMWNDHPWGVGANLYVVRANVEGYNARAGVTWMSTSRGANVHNTYLLLGAELGYLGVGAFLALLGAGIWRAFRLAWAKPRTADGEIALGAGMALVVVALHCRFEWVFVTWAPQYLFAITLGIIAGLAKRRRLETRERRRLAPRPATEQAVEPTWPQPVPVPA